MSMRNRLAVLAIAGALILAGLTAPHAQSSLDSVVNTLTFRNVGPFRTGGWITDIAVPDAPLHDHLYTIYAASRSGGLWKTTNGGVTWEAISDSVDLAAIGAVAIAPSNPSIVWAGSGDQANARSSYSGKGVFKSTDAGRTWQLMGLPDSHHIGRIVIHPTNPEVVYVAAMGHLFSRNDERGVFRTTDGGQTWKKVLFVNAGTGAIDLVMNRRDPNVLFAAMYDKQRLPWRLIEGGAESGVYRTANGGDTWERLGGGLPTGPLGRIGLDIYQKNPTVLYALVENLNPRTGTGAEAAAAAANPATRGGAPPIGVIGNEVYRTDDSGRTWRKTTIVNVAGGKAPYSFNQIRVDPNDDQHLIVTSDSMAVSTDGGRTWTSGDFFRAAFGDFRAMWFDPQDPLRILLGSDGGLQISHDGGRTSDYFPNMRLGEAYAVGVDMDDPYHVYAGFQDHDSWKGPVDGRMGSVSLEDWITVGPGDGMYNVVDPTDSRWVYNTREMNQMGRMDQQTGVRKSIAPTRAAGPRLRFNWIAPIALSPHDPQIVYAGAQVLFRSRDRGDTWEEISPDLTTNDASKIGFPSTPFCTITSISESPLAPGLIWVGTDDGKVHVTQDAGKTWTDVTVAVRAAGAPPDRWVSRVFASPFAAGTAFVSKTGFRNDDFMAYLYRTADFGKTWTAIKGDLPSAPINVVVQDRRNANLLFVGNDIGVYVSIDAGTHWSRLKANLPTVAVHDLTIHPREHDLVIATYGRAIWTGDISPLEELSAGVLNKNVYLFDIRPRPIYGFSTQGMNYELYGNKYIRVPNEPDGLTIHYYLKADQPGGARVTIADASGRTIRQLDGPATAGLNRVVWNFGGGGRGVGVGAATGAATAGEYQVTLEIAGEKLTKPGQVRARIR